MAEEFKRLLTPKTTELTRVNQFMASGTSRGARILNIVNDKIEKQTPSKTQSFVASGNVVYYASQSPIINDHFMVALPKYELTKVRGIVTIPNYLHLSLMETTKWLESSLDKVFNYMPKTKRAASMTKLFNNPTCALDQSGFDHNLSLLQLTTLLENTPYSEFALDMLSEVSTSV